MIDWSDEQRAQIWKLYTLEQLTMEQIAQRYGHLGCTKGAISGVITRINQERDEQVEKDIEMAKDRVGTYGAKPGRSGTYGGYLKKKKVGKLTIKEIEQIRKLKE